MDVAPVSSGEGQAMPTTFAQHCARRSPFRRRAISMTAGRACRATIDRMAPARAEGATPRIVQRDVPTGALPGRTPANPSPTRAFDRLAGPMVLLVFGAGRSGLHALLNHPPSDRRGAIPSQVGMLLLQGAKPGVGGVAEGTSVVPANRLGGAVALPSGEQGVASLQRPVSRRQRCQPAASSTTRNVFCAPSPGGHFFFLRWRNEKGAACAAPR